MKVVPLFALLASILLAGVASGADDDPIVGAAIRGKTHVFAEFVSRTCPACEEMGPVVRQVLVRHPRVVHQVHDADREEDLARRYAVKCVPVYVVVDPEGRTRFNDVGSRTVEELEGILRSAGVGPD